MPQATLATALVCALVLTCPHDAHAFSLTHPAAERFTPVFELDAAGSARAEPAPSSHAPLVSAQAPDISAPPSLDVPRDPSAAGDDAFQDYFDRHFGAHPMTDAAAHRYFRID